MRYLAPLSLCLTTPVAAHAATMVNAAGTLSPALSLLQVTLSLLVILALIMGAAWLAKRYFSVHARTDTTIKMISGLSVGGRERVLLLEVGETWVVVGVAPGHISTLATMPRQIIAADNAGQTHPSFSAAMAARFRQMRGANSE